MAEEIKEKKTPSKSSTQSTKKKASSKKTPTSKKTTKAEVKKKTAKKVESKTTKVTPKKQATPKKKVVQPKEEVKEKITSEKVVSPKIEETNIEKKVETKEDKLEKTIIFDSEANKNIREVVSNLEEDNVLLETKVIKRSKGRKIAIIILVTLMITVIVGVSAYVITDHIRKEENKQTINSNIYKKVSRNYKTLSELEEEIKNKEKDDNTTTKADLNEPEIEYSNIKTISLEEFEEKILKKEDMTILISSTTCYHCLTFDPTINEVFKESDKTIYRINIVALEQEEVTRFRTYYAFTVTPTIFTIKDGYAKSETTGTMSKEDLTEWVKNNI